MKIKFSGYEIEPVQGKKIFLSDYIGKKIIMGIRPEHFISSENAKKEKNVCTMKVKAEISEMTGNETNIHFSLNGKKCIARIKTSEKIHSNDCIELSFRSSSLHFFDINTTQVIG